MENFRILELEGLTQLLRVLWDEGYEVVGPTLSDGAIVYGYVRTVDEFPLGWTDEQEAGAYRLKKKR